jgi:hypothetical protein
MTSENVIYKGTIKGKFTGFKNTITKFEFADGQIWRQNENKFLYTFKQSPEVQIIYKENKYYLAVQGVEETVAVQRIK